MSKRRGQTLLCFYIATGRGASIDNYKHTHIQKKGLRLYCWSRAYLYETGHTGFPFCSHLWPFSVWDCTEFFFLLLSIAVVLFSYFVRLPGLLVGRSVGKSKPPYCERLNCNVKWTGYNGLSDVRIWPRKYDFFFHSVFNYPFEYKSQ